jgi:hypothetical protein
MYIAWAAMQFFLLYVNLNLIGPITVVARCKAQNVFARSNTGIVGSNSILGMDVFQEDLFNAWILSLDLSTPTSRDTSY